MYLVAWFWVLVLQKRKGSCFKDKFLKLGIRDKLIGIDNEPMDTTLIAIELIHECETDSIHVLMKDLMSRWEKVEVVVSLYIEIMVLKWNKWLKEGGK